MRNIVSPFSQRKRAIRAIMTFAHRSKSATRAGTVFAPRNKAPFGRERLLRSRAKALHGRERLLRLETKRRPSGIDSVRQTKSAAPKDGALKTAASWAAAAITNEGRNRIATRRNSTPPDQAREHGCTHRHPPGSRCPHGRHCTARHPAAPRRET